MYLSDAGRGENGAGFLLEEAEDNLCHVVG